MDAIKIAMAQKLAKQVAIYKENPYWESHNGEIWSKKGNKPFDMSDFTSMTELMNVIKGYFKLNYDSFKSEAQVLLVTNDEYAKFTNKNIPELHVSNSPFHVLVLPQVNTWGNTSVSEEFWQKEIVSAGITPYARIHSHHVLHAYQSRTDWSTLNSGTLEIVFGDIYNDIHEIAYWLDVRGTDTKDMVYKTFDLGDTVLQIPNGRPDLTSEVHENLSKALQSHI